MSPHPALIRVVAIGLVLAGGSLALVETRTEAQASSQSRDQKTIADFQKRMSDYVALHRKIELSLPKLPDRSTPEQIDKNQRAFENLMRKTRATAKQGDIFTPQAQPVIRKLMANIFGGDAGKQLKLSIMDENSPNVKVAVNGRYPDNVPLSTIPPQILQTLPKLTEDLEYRFVGNDLILLDTHAHTIADFIPNAFPTY